MPLLRAPPIGAIESPDVKEALRVGFRGWYDPDEDDFKAQTFFCSPPQDNGEQPLFRTADKRLCGFLLLRALRTGSRALSLERGSLLDIILRVRELRPRMWEKVLEQLRVLPVADDPQLGVTEILSSVQTAIRSFVPSEWASEPHLRVSDLTRETLRRTLTVFVATGAMNGTTPHAAPFQHQGNGTMNMLVLALLSMIADAKKTVIFAMEEPEIAIPPSTQKRIVQRRTQQIIPSPVYFALALCARGVSSQSNPRSAARREWKALGCAHYFSCPHQAKSIQFGVSPALRRSAVGAPRADHRG